LSKQLKHLARIGLNTLGVKDVNYTVKHHLLHQSYAWTDFPNGIQLDLDNSCNAFCVYCRPQRDIKSGCKKPAQMPLEILDWVLKDIAIYGRDKLQYLTDFLDGDGLNISLPEKRRHIKKAVPWVQLQTFTNASRPENASLLCVPELDSVCVTLSAHNRAIYKQVHGVDKFEAVLETMRYISEHRLPHQKLAVNYVINKYNIQFIEAWLNLIHANFPDWTPQISPLVVTGDDCESNLAIGDYSTQDQEDAIKKANGTAFWDHREIRGRQPCVLWHNDSITAAGDLLQCCRWDRMDWTYGKAQDYIKNGLGFRAYHMNKIVNCLHNPFCDRCNLKAPDWQQRRKLIDVHGVC
jgi:hypothetical protein